MYSLGYNSFWSFGSAAVQELLTKSDLTLDELLEEDGLILEVKNQNHNLFEFILKEEHFKELISCAISTPDVEKLEHNKKKCYKYPFTCADILSSDSQPIVSEFFKSSADIKENIRRPEVHSYDEDEVNVDDETSDTDKTPTENQTTEEEKEASADPNEFPYLDHLFSFLDSEALNLTSAGYFAKIVNNLLNKRSSELISYIYERKPELLHKMIQHIYSKSIAEFLAKVLTFESSVLANVNNEVFNDKRSEALKEIVKKLLPESDIEEINNTAYLICEVFGKYNTMHHSHEILHNLVEKSIIDYFFDILKSGNSTSACAVALILGNIFAYYILVNTPKVQESHFEDQENSPSNAYHHQPLELSEEIPLLTAFIENLDQIVKFIGSSSGEGIPAQYGSDAAPFGSARLKVLELIIIAMKSNNKKIYVKLVECGFLETLLEIFVRHNWNNMLHNQVEKILTHVIEGSSEELRTALFENAQVLNFIANSSQESDFTLSGKHGRKVRKGYLGHLIRLSNKIVESKDPTIHKYTENNESWNGYVENILVETNKRDQISLGGRDPRVVTQEEDVRLELPSFMQKFGRFAGSKSAEEKEKENEEEEKREEEEEIEEVEDVEDITEEEKPHEHAPVLATSEEFIAETEKHIIRVPSPKAEEAERLAQATVPIRGRHSFDPMNRFIPDYDEEVKEENEKIWVLDAATIKTVEETLDSKYFANNYWKKEELYSADDILKEFEGL